MKNKRRGSLLVFSLVLGFLVAIVMIPVMQYNNQTTRMAYGTRSSDQAFYAAEGGIARALSYIYAAGNGDATGIYDPQFAVGEMNALYPFGSGWLNLDNQIRAGADAPVATKVRIWQDAASGSWSVESVGRSLRPREIYRTVTVTIGAGTFARYSFFNTASLSAIDGRARWLAAGETFNGPVHSNRHLFVYGTFSPNDPLIFNSDVNIVNTEVRPSNTNYHNIHYNGLKDTNAEYVELPSDLTRLTEAAASGGIDLPGDDAWLDTAPPEFFIQEPTPGINNYEFVFSADGSVTYTNLDAMNWLIGEGASAAAARVQASNTVQLDDINGAIVVRDGNVFVNGIVNGRATVAALAGSDTSLHAPFSSGYTDGNLIINGDIVYSTHPTIAGEYDVSDTREFDASTVTDMLGLIAERNFALDGSMPADGIIDAHLMVTGQASPNPDVRDWGDGTGTVKAAKNQDGGFYIEDGNQRDLSELWTGVVDDEPGNGNRTGAWKFGDLYLTGGVVHFIRGQTKNGYGGFSRRYSFDSRMLVTPPPFYPLTPDLDIIGWRDVASTEEN